MVSKSVALALGGVATTAASTLIPAPRARAFALFGGIGVTVLGAAGAWDEIREAGGLSNFLGELTGSAGGIRREQATRKLAADSLAGSDTVAAPGAEGKRFVIPYSGRFLAPTRGGTVSKGFLGATYPMAVSLLNASAQPVSSAFRIAATEKRIVGAAGITVFWSDRLTLDPGEERRIEFDMPLGTGVGGSFSKYHPALMPQVRATLRWPAEPPILPRDQAVTHYQVLV